VKDANVPKLEGHSHPRYGPELKDFRVNDDFKVFIKNKHDGEKFWAKYISVRELTEARWDLFEDGLLLCIQESIILKQSEVEDVNWNVFLQMVKVKISTPESSDSEIREYPVPTSFQNNIDEYEAYTGPKVKKEHWLRFIEQSGFLQGVQQSVQLSLQIQQEDASDLLGKQKVHAVQADVKKGKVMYECGSEYTGERKNGRRHGQGELTLPNGDVYSGTFVKGKREGYGQHSSHREEHRRGYTHAQVYKGEWKEDMRHGYGQQDFYDGSRFTGTWENGL